MSAHGAPAAHGPSGATASGGGPKVIYGAAIIAFMVLFGIMRWRSDSVADTIALQKEAAVAQQAREERETARAIAVARAKGGPQWQHDPPLYYKDFPDDCVEKYVEAWEFKWYLIGKGDAMVFPPHRANPFRASPGEVHNTNHKPGRWQWCKVKEGAGEGVEVHQLVEEKF